MTVEKAAREGHMRQLYDTTERLAGNYRKSVKSKEGKVTTNIEEAHTNFPIYVGPPTIEEISMAIRQIKSGKVAGPYNIPAEALNANVTVNARILHILFSKTWDEEQVPTNRKKKP
ncbi:unnamed protein product [Schistosoma curassoni]|uniref:ApbA_C domain-containing protein n=1 Tax=Schistosoma curassoni TaxID=6186 RepID=A0A183JNT8_9TREM|nr:unnamed protein product [Schistosoma curassoni]